MPDTFERLSGTGPVWDSALINSPHQPNRAIEQQVLTPPESTQREIWVYTPINEEKIIADWWRTVEKNR